MNSTGKISFTCRVVRLRDALTGSLASSHLAHCADCQAYFRTSDTLVGKLRQTAPHATQPTPDDLAQHISRAVRQAVQQPRRRSKTLWLSTFAGAAAAVAVTFFIVRQNPTHPTVSPNQQPSPILHPAGRSELFANVDSLRTRLLTSVGPSAEQLATDNPLTRELDSVQADARSALNFLALNFLPSDSAEKIRSKIEPTHS